MIDPNCCHKVQCTKGPFSLQNGFVRENKEHEADSSDDERDDGSSSAERPSSETVTRYQRGNKVFCCGHGQDADYGARDYGYSYSFILFEKCTGDALSFLRSAITGRRKNKPRFGRYTPGSVCAAESVVMSMRITVL